MADLWDVVQTTEFAVASDFLDAEHMRVGVPPQRRVMLGIVGRYMAGCPVWVDRMEHGT
jgi:hypothetical protein